MVEPKHVAKSLPEPLALERRCVALAMLDAILSPDWESRYHSFNRRWDPDTGSRMGSMRDGSGDDYYVLFLADGRAALKGFAHESAALAGQSAIPGVLTGIPDGFAAFLGEPAFDMQAATFALWNDGARWQRSEAVATEDLEQDGSGELLGLLFEEAAAYAQWAADYFDVEVNADVVARFFQLEPLTPDLAYALAPDADLELLEVDLEEIGYPVVAHTE